MFDKLLSSLYKIFNISEDTPISLAIITIIVTSYSAIGTICSIIHKHYLLIFLFLVPSLLWAYIESKYIKIESLYLDNDTFLINTIATSIETARLRSDGHNNVDIVSVDFNYTIEKNNELNVTHSIVGTTLSKELINYYYIFSKSEVGQPFNPVIRVTCNGMAEDCYSGYNKIESDLFNTGYICFKDGKLFADKRFKIEFDINNYYTFNNKECEVLIINPLLYGNLKNTAINVNVSSCSQISSSPISVYRINKANFSRKKFVNLLKKKITENIFFAITILLIVIDSFT